MFTYPTATTNCVGSGKRYRVNSALKHGQGTRMIGVVALNGPLPGNGRKVNNDSNCVFFASFPVHGVVQQVAFSF